MTELLKISLPDGSVREMEQGSTPADVAAAIGPGLAKAAIAAALLEHVWPLLAAGRVAPVMDSTYALADAAKAHAYMESSAHIGKIVLKVG